MDFELTLSFAQSCSLRRMTIQKPEFRIRARVFKRSPGQWHHILHAKNSRPCHAIAFTVDHLLNRYLTRSAMEQSCTKHFNALSRRFKDRERFVCQILKQSDLFEFSLHAISIRLKMPPGNKRAVFDPTHSSVNATLVDAPPPQNPSHPGNPADCRTQSAICSSSNSPS